MRKFVKIYYNYSSLMMVGTGFCLGNAERTTEFRNEILLCLSKTETRLKAIPYDRVLRERLKELDFNLCLSRFRNS